MALKKWCCFTWIVKVWAQLVSSFTTNFKTHPPLHGSVIFESYTFNYKTLPPLPDSVIFDILSRVPTQCVSICRRVCKKWLELTSTTDFAHTHLQRHSNSGKEFLMQCIRIIYAHTPHHQPRFDCFFILNKEAKGERIFTKILPDLNRPIEDYLTASAYPIMNGSFNGILVFKPQVPGHSYYLLNPTTHERINIRCNGGILSGFFFHTSKKEYVLLCNRKVSNNDGMFDYFLFSLESDSIRKVCTFPYYSTTNQVYSNGSLYWIIDYASNNTCENSMMAFNAETGVLTSFPHPDKHCGNKCKRAYMHLLENTGQLLFCRTFEEDYINMWVKLEDDKKSVWVKRYVVHLDWNIMLYPFDKFDKFEQQRKKILVLNVDNGELLLFWRTRGLFAYNLEEKKVRKFDLGEAKLEELTLVGYILSASCYAKSLVSLKVPMKHPNVGKFPTYGQVTIDLE